MDLGKSIEGLTAREINETNRRMVNTCDQSLKRIGACSKLIQAINNRSGVTSLEELLDKMDSKKGNN